MPHSTYKFAFEFKVFLWADKFSRMMTADNRAFLIIFNHNGSSQRIFFSDNHSFDHTLMEMLTTANQSWFLYDPFDAPEYISIMWKNLSQNTFERLMNESFNEADFIEADAKIEFPISWGVVF